MGNDRVSLVEESINLELNVADAYLLFHDLFPEDKEFWWKLVVEEKNHAALIRTGKEHFELENNFPHELLTSSLQDLKNENNKIKSLIKKYESNTPSREEVFNIALNLENSAAELHFQDFMDKEADSKMSDIFKKLNQEDKNHAKRISSYMKANGIQIRS